MFCCSVGSFLLLTGAPRSGVCGFQSSKSMCSGSSGQPVVAKLDPEPEEEHFTLNATVIFQDRVFVSNRSNIDVWSYHIPQLEKNSCSPLTIGIILFLKSINWWISFLIFQKKVEALIILTFLFKFHFKRSFSAQCTSDDCRLRAFFCPFIAEAASPKIQQLCQEKNVQTTKISRALAIAQSRLLCMFNSKSDSGTLH